jgi:hypothetical protein
MNASRTRLALTLLIASTAVGAASGQRNTTATGDARPARRGPEAKPIDSLPQDEKIKDLYFAFVRDAEKVAAEYERQNKHEQARAVYHEILRLFPNYKKARDKLDEYEKKEATADKKTVEVTATKGWQDTGINAIAGKMLTFTATGSWTVKVSQQVGADGLAPPKDMGSFPLGSLVGVVIPPKNPKDKETPKPQPFLIGASRQITPPVAGELMLRMFDSEADDNNGRLRVEIQGTFERK